MEAWFYRVLAAVSRRTGLWFFALVSGGIAAGYLAVSRHRRAVGERFYRALFPGKHRWHALWCTWRQFRQFTTVFMDRMLLSEPGRITYTFTGWSHLTELLDRGQGAILLMSHIGNWEVAAQLLGRQRADLRLMLYMGSKEKEAIERLQKQDLVDGGIRVVAVDRDAASPFDLVTGMQFIRAGGVVSMTGDMIWHTRQPSVPVRFLGHEARLPDVPYRFALLTGAPLVVFFSHRTGPGRYHFSFSPPIRVFADSRAARPAAITAAAQTYADLMSDAVRRAPFEWFHFQSFLGRRVAP